MYFFVKVEWFSTSTVSEMILLCLRLLIKHKFKYLSSKIFSLFLKEGAISKISVPGLQKIIFAKLDPWGAIIFSAFEKISICSSISYN